MTKDELIERLKGYEWDDVEFKRARKGVPEDAYRTVSAFANTSGGWLVVSVLLKPLEPGRLFTLADQLRDRYVQKGETGDYCLSSEMGDRQDVEPGWDQVGTKLGLSSDQVLILQNLVSEQAIAGLMGILGRTNRTKFRDQVLNPLIDAGLIEMTIPGKPRSSKQKYR